MLGSKAGAEIDSHSCVVRMNDAPTIGFEEDVGSRTTIRLGSFVLVHKLNGSKYRFLFGKERAEYNLYWGLEGRSSSKLASYLRTVVKKNGSHSEVYYQNSKGEDLQNEVFRNMTGQSRMESRSWLSTGWFTFQLCLDVCDKLDVYGMVPENYCSRNRTEVKYHYYQGGRKPSECSTYKFVEVTRKHAHRFMTEKAVFAKWGALYNVSFHHPQWNLALEAGKNITTPFILRQNKKGNAVNAKRVIRRSVIRRPVVRRAVVSRKH